MSEGEAQVLPGRSDEAGWRRLFEEWDPRLRGYLVRLLPDARDAEEVTLETFALAWRTGERFRGGKVSTWLFGIATNLARNRRRGWLRRVARFAGLVPEVHDAGIEDTSRADEVARSVRDAVQGLPEDLRAPLILTAFEGFSQHEAAESLGLSAKAVEHRVSRAREILRRKLG